MITDPERAVSRLIDMVTYGRVRSEEAIMAAVVAETACIHGDSENAVAFARSLNERLLENGIAIKAINDR